MITNMAAHSHRHNRGRRPRQNEEFAGSSKQGKEVDESSEVIINFRKFQKELDQRNDRHERLVKLSRDITIESKRLIFFLHRVTGGPDVKKEILKEADTKMQELYRSKFLPLAAELKDQDSYQFLRAFSPGLQEYIEAVTFYYYLKDQELVGVEKIQRDINLSFEEVNKQNNNTESTISPTAAAIDESVVEASSPEDEGDDARNLEVPLPLIEYMLGIADFTGELMRMAINCVGSGDLDTPKQITDLMRNIHNAFASFSNAPRELRRKANVLRQSLHKVENACYNLRVRGSEIPKHMLADVFTTTHSSLPDDNFNGENEEMI